MKYIIDTQILIWQISGNTRIHSDTIGIITNADNEVYVSWASIWEITVKASIGKLFLGISLSELEKYLNQNGYKILDFNFRYFDVLKTLNYFHRDPFDRLIISQAIAEALTLITSDDKMEQYDVKLILNK